MPVASKGKSVKNAVPGQRGGKDAMTQREMQPPKANGGMQILDTWSLTLTSTSSITSKNPSKTWQKKVSNQVDEVKTTQCSTKNEEVLGNGRQDPKVAIQGSLDKTT